MYKAMVTEVFIASPNDAEQKKRLKNILEEGKKQ